MGRKNNNFYILFFVLLILLVGCRPPNSGGSVEYREYRTGTDGLVMNFLSGAPRDRIYADEDLLEVPISVEVRNKGAYPTTDERRGEDNLWLSGTINNLVFVSGFDHEIIPRWDVDGVETERKIDNKYPFIALGDKMDTIEGKSINNPNGGYELFDFIARVNMKGIDELYSPTFLVTACYNYKTIASPNVCIDPRPFTTVKERKVCEVSDVSLKSQGAPIAITKIESRALSNSIQFKINFKNSGKGDVIATDSLSKCHGANNEHLEKTDMDYIKIADVSIGGRSFLENCGPLVEVDNIPGYSRLVEGEGYIICNLKDYKDGVNSAYTSPLYIELLYGYRNTISKKVDIIRVPEAK